MDPLHALYGIVACVVLSCWRIAWLGLVVPAWRVFWKGCLILAGAYAVNKLDGEFEDGAYRS